MQFYQMLNQGVPNMENAEEFFNGPMMGNYLQNCDQGEQFGSEDDYISDEEFQKGLTDQEKTIFNALVISIN